MSDLPSQHTETDLWHILFPEPGKLCLGPLLPCWSWVTKGQQELRPRGPFDYAPLSPYLKDIFDKFKQDSLASNLPESKFINPYFNSKLLQGEITLFFEDNLQELNMDLLRSVSLLNPLEPLWASSPTSSEET